MFSFFVKLFKLLQFITNTKKCTFPSKSHAMQWKSTDNAQIVCYAFNIITWPDVEKS